MLARRIAGARSLGKFGEVHLIVNPIHRADILVNRSSSIFVILSVGVNEWKRADQKGLASAISINKVGYCRREVYFSGPLPCRDTGRAIAISPHQNPSNSLHWSVLFRWVSMGLISPEPLSLTMRQAAPLDFQELARASGVARQSVTLELRGSRWGLKILRFPP